MAAWEFFLILAGVVVSVPLAGDGADTVSRDALATLRNQLLPSTLGKVPGISYAVTGDTAQITDDVHQLKASLPAVFAVVALLAFCLLLAAFRSVAVPLVSIVLKEAYGLSSAEAGRASAWAIRTLAAAYAEHPEALDPQPQS